MWKTLCNLNSTPQYTLVHIFFCGPLKHMHGTPVWRETGVKSFCEENRRCHWMQLANGISYKSLFLFWRKLNLWASAHVASWVFFLAFLFNPFLTNTKQPGTVFFWAVSCDTGCSLSTEQNNDIQKIIYLGLEANLDLNKIVHTSTLYAWPER